MASEEELKAECALQRAQVKTFTNKKCHVKGSGCCHCWKPFIDTYEKVLKKKGITPTSICVVDARKSGQHTDASVRSHGAHVTFEGSEYVCHM